MEISFAFGSFIVVLGACAMAARQRRSLSVAQPKQLGSAGQPGFLRRLAS